MNMKKVKPLTKVKSEDEKMKEAFELLQKNKHEREQAFQIELKALCEKYGINLSTKILITAI
jgi:membrane protein insertase Oxa1/YidC/SpoIIIJ